MEVVKFDALSNAFLQVFKKVIRDLHVSLEVNVFNKHSTLSLCQPEFFTPSNVKGLMEDDVDPSKRDTAQISGMLASRGILSFKVQGEQFFHYLVITWAVKTAMKKGRNSITVTIMNNKPERRDRRYLYKNLHRKDNRKYPGDNINLNNLYYRISGGITDGDNAKLNIVLKNTEISSIPRPSNHNVQDDRSTPETQTQAVHYIHPARHQNQRTSPPSYFPTENG
ncbi:8754_t:CDS:2 [Acaulospora morrowiae]|uniref:8754_t:CDS:1 n=1 Tax=Acaulospora morrowiae TaxID=94023 RepID=A0A9N9G603_9GLOM|nr:8754_t:CDS:2 [Acaulospora morrowiae]